MTDEKFGSFEDLVDLANDDLKPIVLELRSLVLEIDQNACEVVRLGEKAATYGLGPRKMIEGYCYIMPNRSWVNLGFYQGAHLIDPNTLLEGTGKNLRHVKIHSLEQVCHPAIRSLVVAALSERRSALA